MAPCLSVLVDIFVSPRTENILLISLATANCIDDVSFFLKKHVQ